MGVGETSGFDRLTALRLGAAVERRLTERPVRTLAVAIPAELLADELDAAAAVELITRGVVEGTEDPRRIYEPDRAGPPALDELILIVASGDAALAADDAVGPSGARRAGERRQPEQPELLKTPRFASEREQDRRSR